MNEYREKNKKKVADIGKEMSELSSKHRHEMVGLKQLYEEKIKRLEGDLDQQQR